MSKLRVILSGGGTGGHIFPAIAIADAIKAKKPDTEFLFVGALGKMEMEKVPAAGYAIQGLWISGLQRKLSLQNLSFPFKLIHSMLKARRIVKQFKPHVAVGTGGFASGPLLKAAIQAGVPSVLQEQNAYPGITNKLLAKDAKLICVAYAKMENYFPKEKILISGNPVRKNVVNIEGKREKALAFFDLDASIPVLLVIGGSLGAKSINDALQKKLNLLVDANIQVLWQTGKTSFESAKKTAASYPQNSVRVHEFIYDMDFAYAAADIIVSRAGAIAVSELCLIGKPAILVPFPFAAEDHQTKNAMSLVAYKAAIHIADNLADEMLVKTIIETIRDTEKCERLALEIKKLGVSDSAEIIADEIIKLATN
jgi:UDP-N-acetylglucosamine--N-acetylmuramyl-(pentapeptide) pyrophosphoryl-undecaprenol N-acetylglucosamine transferase